MLHAVVLLAFFLLTHCPLTLCSLDGAERNQAPVELEGSMDQFDCDSSLADSEYSGPEDWTLLNSFFNFDGSVFDPLLSLSELDPRDSFSTLHDSNPLINLYDPNLFPHPAEISPNPSSTTKGNSRNALVDHAKPSGLSNRLAKATVAVRQQPPHAFVFDKYRRLPQNNNAPNLQPANSSKGNFHVPGPIAKSQISTLQRRKNPIRTTRQKVPSLYRDYIFQSVEKQIDGPMARSQNGGSNSEATIKFPARLVKEILQNID